MSLVIPTPAAVERADGALGLDALRAVSVRDPALRAVAECFRAALQQYAGITVPPTTVDEVTPPRAIRIELGPAIGEHRTRGLRADGADPGLEWSRVVVRPEDALVTAATPEGLHRALTSLVQCAATGDGLVPCGAVDDVPTSPGAGSRSTWSGPSSRWTSSCA